jgi:hypothetical protein
VSPKPVGRLEGAAGRGRRFTGFAAIRIRGRASGRFKTIQGRSWSMKLLKVVRLGLAAGITVPLVLSASASASLPEFSGPFPKAFKTKTGAITIETVNKVKARCKAGTGEGEVTGPTSGKLTARFTGCEVLNFLCTSKGAAPGEIVANPLSVTLGYINSAKKEVGLAEEAATSGPLAEAMCGPVHVVETGSLIGRITPLNRKVLAGRPVKVKFAQAKGKQKPTKLEGGPIDVLMISTSGGAPEEAGVAAKAELTFAETVEING